jgi:hypothetical protein
MKKFCLLMTLAALLFMCTGALADEGDTHGVENMPEAVKAIIDSSNWNSWEITGWVNPKGIQSDTACAFAVVKKGSQNDLLAFGQSDGSWQYKWHNAAALPQVEAPVVLADLQLFGFEQDTNFTSLYVLNEELQEMQCIWTQQRDGTWHLQHLRNYFPFMCFDTSVEGALRWYIPDGPDSDDSDVWVYGNYQTDLRYFDLSAFPRTAEEARQKLSNPPKIPAGTLMAKEVLFSSGDKYSVLQGPGAEYGLSGNGKAIVSTNDWIQVFGKEGEWILIQYDISSDSMRIGWIPAGSLPHKTAVPELDFSPIEATLNREANLTDDPLKSQATVATLAQGAKVNWLASMGEWAYVEGVGIQAIRGFVKIEALETEPGVK